MDKEQHGQVVSQKRSETPNGQKCIGEGSHLVKDSKTDPKCDLLRAFNDFSTKYHNIL